MIEDLLVPTDEARNEHKRLQLQELAALNGAQHPADSLQSISQLPAHLKLLKDRAGQRYGMQSACCILPSDADLYGVQFRYLIRYSISTGCDPNSMACCRYSEG